MAPPQKLGDSCHTIIPAPAATNTTKQTERVMCHLLKRPTFFLSPRAKPTRLLLLLSWGIAEGDFFGLLFVVHRESLL